jgi:CRISPR system Cascade subunit CasD
VSRHTLLLRCEAPLQSWGTRSRFTDRDTEREPTKSGILGLLCAALGRPREAPLDDLSALRLGARADREGVLLRDFHTALEVRKADPKAGTDTLISQRYYLSDAVFLVGLEGEDAVLLGVLDEALAQPVWPLYLGRKACVPSQPVRLPDGLRRETALEKALAEYPLLRRGSERDERQRRRVEGEAPPLLRLTLECLPGEDGEERSDVPLSFVSEARAFAVRRVRTLLVPRPTETLGGEVASCT